MGKGRELPPHRSGGGGIGYVPSWEEVRSARDDFNQATHAWIPTVAAFREAEDRWTAAGMSYQANLLGEAADQLEAVCMVAERYASMLDRAMYGWPRESTPPSPPAHSTRHSTGAAPEAEPSRIPNTDPPASSSPIPSE